jgi:SNF2 family DNA or RNA helicase
MMTRHDDSRGVACWIEVGLGKTVSALTACVDLISDLSVHRILVVGPKKVVKYVWTDEAQSWEHTKHLRIAVAVGTAKERIAALDSSADIVCINVENLQWLEATLVARKELKFKGDQSGRHSCFDMVIVDESDLLKNRSTRRYLVMKHMMGLASHCALLTGTPATEGYQHLWSQFSLLDSGKRLLGNYTSYLQTYFVDVTRGQSSYPILRVKGEQAKQAIQSRVADITFTLTAKENLQLPEENRIFRFVELDARETAVYSRFARKATVELGGGVITAMSAGVLVQKLAQFANGQCYDENRNVHVLHRRKLEELQLIYNESSSPLLVSVEYRHDRALIAAEFGARIFDDKVSTKDDWNARKFPMMLIHPRSGAHGLNLQFGGHVLVRYGVSYSLGLFLQLFGRLRRSGQPSPFVTDHVILTRGTIDEEIAKVIESKHFTHEALLSAMSAHTKSLGV